MGSLVRETVNILNTSLNLTDPLTLSVEGDNDRFVDDSIPRAESEYFMSFGDGIHLTANLIVW